MNAGVHRGVIKLMFAIVRQKKLQPLAHDRFIDGLSSESPLNQNRGAIPT